MEQTGQPATPLRDTGLLESALMRPQMAAFYEQADLIRQATLLAVGIPQAQAFLDGNKRAAFAALIVFLRLNGLKYSGDPMALARQLEAVASREDDLDSAARFEAWLRERITEMGSR
jgi:death-on-curing protein